MRISFLAAAKAVTEITNMESKIIVFMLLTCSAIFIIGFRYG
jgi:hypothetical protein